MADKSPSSADQGFAPVSIPPRGFEMDELQKALESVGKGLKEGEDQESAMRAAVEKAIAPNQPPLEMDFSVPPDHTAVNVEDEFTGGVRRAIVFVPAESKDAELKAAVLAGTEGMVLSPKGKAVEATIGDGDAASISTEGN